MIRSTFLHLPGIGPGRERALWRQGILDWAGFQAAVESRAVKQAVFRDALPWVLRSAQAIDARDVAHFGNALPTGELWRIFGEFADQALFLDIETTGLSADYDEVTMVGAFARGQTALFIQGVNLDEFPEYAAQFPLLVSFNGSMFDVPFLRAWFPGARLDQAHIDLRFVLASLGLRGGLKSVERQLGLRRDRAIAEVDGFEAVRLWYRYRRGDRQALEKLVLYNLADVVNLVELLERAIDMKTQALGFPGEAPARPPLVRPKVDAALAVGWTARLLDQAGTTPQVGWHRNLSRAKLANREDSLG
ncbi:MAG: ribonuclease H-like domain-containing protein [Pirellulales bacterium]